MLASILAVLICLSPAALLFVGYYVGRYGSPIVIKRQARRDRRLQVAPEESDSELEVYHA